jgi:MFS family permease
MRQPSNQEAHVQGTNPSRKLIFKTFVSLQHRDFRILWIGILFMSAGVWVQQVTVGWLLYDLTGSAVLLGALNGLRALPYLVLGLFVGAFIDRVDRRKFLLFVQPFMMITTFTIGVLIISKQIQVWHLFAFVLISGIAWSISQPLRQALVPNLVPTKHLTNALSLTAMGHNITKVLGPAIGGLLIAAIGAGGNFFVQAVAYTGVLFMVIALRVPEDQVKNRQTSAIADIKEGLRYVRSRPAILGVIATALIPPLFAMPYMSLMPIFQKDVLGVGPGELGMMMAAPGIGALVSLSTLATFGDRIRRKGVWLLSGLGLFGVFIILFSITPSYPLALLPLVGAGFCHLTYITTSYTMLQLLTPDDLRGRVMSLYYLNRGLGPLGSVLAGVMAESLGAPFTVTIMASVVVLLAAVLAWRVPVIHQVET